MMDRRYPIGAEVVSNGTSFRVWAPACQTVEVCHEGDTTRFLPLQAENNGYFSGTLDLKAGDCYRFRLDGSSDLYADPASRFQPDGPLGPSQVVDPGVFQWDEGSWKGRGIEGQILYELHLGTFTHVGTLAAAEKHLPELAELGITTIQLMPLNDFPGHFGWGYDGVDLFAPCRLYGGPDDVRSFVNRAHQLGLGVILDIVYNHFGPRGCFMDKFSPNYFQQEDTEWGRAINFDDPDTRLFFITNARYWIQEYHFDGFRVDAVHAIKSTSAVHILADLTREARAAAGDRQIIIVGENEAQESTVVRSIEEGGYGFDMVYNEDFHHSAIVRLTGRSEAYYSDYRGTAQELLSCMKYGFLYQGQYYTWQKKNRGTPSLDLKSCAFGTFLQNHDQVANTSRGLRIHLTSDPGNLKAMTCLLLLGPGVPLLFQGQEFASSAPFYYFADHEPELAKLVARGRRKFLAQFESQAIEEMQAAIPNPEAPETFTCCKIDFNEREKNSGIYKLTKDLIRLRKEDPLLGKNERMMDGAILSNAAFFMRFFDRENQLDRLLLFNFDVDVTLDPAAEPLLAPVEGCTWKQIWSSESLQYNGVGNPTLGSIWSIPGHSATVLTTIRR